VNITSKGYAHPPAEKNKKQTKTKQGVCHIVSSPFTLKNILRQKNVVYREVLEM
jgi:hypothetical protein